jgi:hypothetical protein
VDPIERARLGTLAARIGGVIALAGLVALVVAIAMRPASSEPPLAPIVPAVPPPPPPTDAGTDVGPVAVPPVVYALDDFPRRPEIVSEGCPDIALVDHEGPWRPALRVHASFVEAVTALEAAIQGAAHEVYGQEVAVMLSASSYRCTTVRGRPERISEHALGNAIDLRGIALPDGTETTVRDHWHAASPETAVHAHFWRALVERVHSAAIFRGILGPPDPDHMDHLHFDRGPSVFFDLSFD